MIWSFINEPSIANQTRVWITALSQKCLKFSPKITYCPNHPGILLKVPPPGTNVSCIIKECMNLQCDFCHKWHKIGECQVDSSIPPGCRICPYCKNCVEKNQACNHISCRCGKHFCYYCGGGPFNEGQSCYSHMGAAGHWIEAPDYLRFCQHQSISDQDLLAFYQNFPQWNPFKKQ